MCGVDSRVGEASCWQQSMQAGSMSCGRIDAVHAQGIVLLVTAFVSWCDAACLWLHVPGSRCVCIVGHSVVKWGTLWWWWM